MLLSRPLVTEAGTNVVARSVLILSVLGSTPMAHAEAAWVLWAHTRVIRMTATLGAALETFIRKHEY